MHKKVYIRHFKQKSHMRTMRPMHNNTPWIHTSFGSVMQGRAYSSAAYRFGFNGKEKEADGTADNYDFGARIYDGRLGRWLAVDPLWEKFRECSPFNFCKSSPIILIDIDGRDIVNGAQEQLSTATTNLNIEERNLADAKSKYGTTRKEIKKYCKEHNISKADCKTTLKSIKNLISNVENLRGQVEQFKSDVKRIDELICNLESQSPQIYKTMSSITDDFNNPIDVVITLENLMSHPSAYHTPGESDVAGETAFDETSKIIETGGYANSISIKIERDANNYELFAKNKGEDPLRHELGHAFYMITQSDKYRAYKIGLKINNRDYAGGHNDDDKSGMWATYFGTNLDLDTKNTDVK